MLKKKINFKFFFIICSLLLILIVFYLYETKYFFKKHTNEIYSVNIIPSYQKKYLKKISMIIL